MKEDNCRTPEEEFAAQSFIRFTKSDKSNHMDALFHCPRHALAHAKRPGDFLDTILDTTQGQIGGIDHRPENGHYTVKVVCTDSVLKRINEIRGKRHAIDYTRENGTSASR